MNVSIRKRVYEILEVGKKGDRVSKGFDIFIIVLIGLNIIALILESDKNIFSVSPHFYKYFEIVSVIIFSIEYVLRVWSCVENPKYTFPTGRIKYVFTFMSLVDLFAVLPFYIPLLGIDLRFLRAIRMLRIARIAKFGRYSRSLQIINRVFKERKEQLICAVFFLIVLLTISSSLMYYAENSAQPESFESIPKSMWWAVATLTTVGYGDVYPITPLGKLMASFIAILGIGMFALPTGILGAGFMEEINKNKKVQICPHCGEKITDG